MAGISHLDEVIDYKGKIINLLANSKEVVGLLLSNPNIDMTSPEAYAVRDNNMYDYDYVDETLTIAKPIIMVEAEVPNMSSPTMKNISVYVQIVVPKTMMKIDGKIFKGVKGNLKDNLARQIDLILNDNNFFGIGGLNTDSLRLAVVPDTLTSTMLTYRTVNFAKNRNVGND